jgi:hypothetical protein
MGEDRRVDAIDRNTAAANKTNAAVLTLAMITLKGARTQSDVDTPEWIRDSVLGLFNQLDPTPDPKP